MTKRLLTAFALQGAVSLPFSRPTAHAQGKYCAKRFFILLFSLAALVSFTSTGTRAQNLSVTKLRRIAPFRLNNLPEGSRVTITSDSALDDYTAYKSADRFHVLIPQAELSALLKDLHGRGFTDIQVERRGSDLDLSFVLQPGATASVTQKFNRLDVTFSVPADLVASVVVTATEATTTAQTNELAAKAVPPASGEKVSLPAAPTPTPEPPSASSSSSSEAKPSGKGVAGGGKPGIVLPPEKANPVTVARFDKPPVIDGKLDEAVWQQATVFKDFYQFRPGDNIAPSQPTEALVGYDAKFLYIAFRAHDEPGKVRATVAKRDAIFDDDFVGVFLDTFNDHRRAYEFLFNPLGVQADSIYTEGSGEDFSVDVVMESKGAVTSDGYTVEIAIPFKSLRYEAGKGKFWGVHFLRTIKRFNNEQDSWMPISRSNSSTLDQAGRITGLEGISAERTLELIPSLTVSETGKRVSSFTPPATGIDPGRMVNEPVHFDPGLTAKFGLTPTVTLDLALNPDFAQVEADQTVVTANQRFPIFFAEKRPFFLEGIDIFQTPLTAVHTRAIIDPDVAVKLSGKRGRNSFGLMLASDNGPGNFIGDERLNPNNFRFLDKNAYIGVLRLKRDIGKGENTLGMIATTYNFIEKHNQLLGFDGRFRFNKQMVASFQMIGTSSRRFFFEPDQGETLYRTGNAAAYSFRIDKDGRNFGWNYDARGFTRDYRADVGFTRRTNTNRHGLFVYYNTDPKPKATLISAHFHILPEINFDWQGRIQSWGNEVQTQLQFKKQTYMGLGVSLNYERIFEEEFGTTRNAPATRCFSAAQLNANPLLHCGFAGDDSERSTNRDNIYGYAGTTPSKKYSLSMFTIYNWGAFDFDFGAGPRFPRVSPAALLNPSAPLDPGKGNNWHFEGSAAYQPTNALRLSLDYTKDRLVRRDTGRVAFDENIFAFRGTYQFTRFTFARARVDYDTLAANVRGQFLLGWAPNPGTSFYVGYNDDLSLNGYGPISGQLEPGFRRNGRTFFVKMSYLFRRSF
jgi:predicted porin